MLFCRIRRSFWTTSYKMMLFAAPPPLLARWLDHQLGRLQYSQAIKFDSEMRVWCERAAYGSPWTTYSSMLLGEPDS